MRRSARLYVLALPLVFAGCVADTMTEVAADDDDTAGTTGEPADTFGPAATDGEGSTGEPEAPFEPYPARGIEIVEMYANQGVAVPVVGPGGTWIDGSGRNAELVQGRNTLIRGYWQLADDFVPRELEARITLSYPDGTTEEASKVMMVEGESTPSNLDSNVYFVIPGELIRPLVEFQVELFETTVGYEDLPEPEIAAFPTEPGFLGIEDSSMVLKAVLVPIRHDLGSECPEPPEVTEEAVEYLSNALFQQNPVQEVELTVRETYDYDESMRSFGGLLGALADLRAADNAPADVYYYGLVRPCDGGPDGVGGQAISIPSFPTQSNAWTRTAVGRWYGSFGSTANTFVHEIGHTQGRRHIHCSGEEGGSDPSYPYELGDIGVWGFGVIDFTLHTPTNAKDYMTYCGNTWVSDWGWRAVVPFIKEITTWQFGDAAPAPTSSRILVGLFDEQTGDETWFVTQGTAEGRAANPADVFEVTGPHGDTRVLASSLGSMGDHGYNVVVELPDDVTLDEDLAIMRVRGTERVRVSSVRTPAGRLTLRQ